MLFFNTESVYCKQYMCSIIHILAKLMDDEV